MSLDDGRCRLYREKVGSDPTGPFEVWRGPSVKGLWREGTFREDIVYLFDVKGFKRNESGPRYKIW